MLFDDPAMRTRSASYPAVRFGEDMQTALYASMPALRTVQLGWAVAPSIGTEFRCQRSGVGTLRAHGTRPGGLDRSAKSTGVVVLPLHGSARRSRLG
jgi:hypothetical protein